MSSCIRKNINPLLGFLLYFEALRAGKGFAVVASEVKSLATQTGRATEIVMNTAASSQ